jgi:SNF2 family DNA or RNA helicase
MNEHVEVIKRAILFLAGRCDGAVKLDGVGFNKWDSNWGHRAADRVASGWEINPVYAVRIVTKYRGQLEAAGIVLPSYETVKTEAEAEAKAKATETPSRPGVQVSQVGSALEIRFSYDPALITLVKEIPGRRWNPSLRVWTAPLGSLGDLTRAFPDAVLDEGLAKAAEEKRLAEEKVEKIRRAETEAAVAAWTTTVRADVVRRMEEQRGESFFAHQDAGILWLIEKRKAILADDMGLAKTRQALCAARALGFRVIVVGPAGLKTDPWLREAELVDIPIEYYSWAKVPEALEGDFTLIGDEAHYAQSLKAKRTQRFLALADAAKACFLLTGTPIKNGRPANLFPLLSAINHDLAKNRKTYEVRYCAASATRWTRWDVSGAAHLEELHEKISDAVMRRMKSECMDLPAKTRVLRKAELSVEAQEKYDSVLGALQRDYRDRRARGVIKEADAIVLLNHLRHAGSIAKVEAAVEIANEILEQGGQVVLFTAFLDSAGLIAETLQAGRITGAEDGATRQKAIDAFQRGELKSMVCTLGAGNVGITLHAAQTAILVDRPWTPGDAVQAEDRLHRIGQKNAVLAVWLQVNGADEAIDALLEQKHQRIEVILEGKKKSTLAPRSIGDVAEVVLG